MYTCNLMSGCDVSSFLVGGVLQEHKFKDGQVEELGEKHSTMSQELQRVREQLRTEKEKWAAEKDTLDHVRAVHVKICSVVVGILWLS